MKFRALILILCLGLGGCATLPAGPPPGCEDSWLWKSGFLPGGREVVELGVAALVTAEPSLKEEVKVLGLKGWRLARDGSLRAAVAELVSLLEKKPQYAPLALFVLQRLDLDRQLPPCDQEVLVRMFRNIALYAGAAEQDFAAGARELAKPQP